MDRDITLSQSLDHFDSVRKTTESICAPLQSDDYMVQSMPDVSPPKWHLAHTSWFFETLILKRYLKGYEDFHPKFHLLFNSYYESLGDRLERAHRGFLSRPSIEEIYRYRHHVNSKIHELLNSLDSSKFLNEFQRIFPTLELGIHHEQQHQELLLTDILHNFWANPLKPVYLKSKVSPSPSPLRHAEWFEVQGGLYSIGHRDNQFAFDNETPHHKVFLEDFRIQSRLVTNGEYLEFIESKGYQNPLYWLSDGWRTVSTQKWQSPLYWEKQGNQWLEMTLSGMLPLEEEAPVSHLSFYEADAYARWKGCSLPTEVEWEIAASQTSVSGNFLENCNYRPIALKSNASGLQQMWGDVWEWSSSPYRPYPGFRPLEGPASEYNGKFMCNQMVLRGGSCVTPRSHIRSTYRNFFSPESRWQFSGLRLSLCAKKS